MINNVSIKNFKSLKDVSFESRRVNVFIGEPNTGKSNLLEALGVFSLKHNNYRKILRYKALYDLFFDNDVYEPILISAGSYTMKIAFQDEKCLLTVSDSNSVDFVSFGGNALRNTLLLTLENNRAIAGDAPTLPFRYYKFSNQSEFSSQEISFLSVPDGNNLLTILHTNKELQEVVKAILEDKGYKLNLRPASKEVEIAKDNGVLISYPYHNISDTLQRIIFYLAAIKSNKDAIILLEEPETNTFPFYTKYLAERIAFEESNQYFIVTHNPYFLLSLVEKTPIDQLAVFITYMENYETKLRPLSSEDLSELMDLNTDIFFNLDKFLSSPDELLS